MNLTNQLLSLRSDSVRGLFLQVRTLIENRASSKNGIESFKSDLILGIVGCYNSGYRLQNPVKNITNLGPVDSLYLAGIDDFVCITKDQDSLRIYWDHNQEIWEIKCFSDGTSKVVTHKNTERLRLLHGINQPELEETKRVIIEKLKSMRQSS